MPGSPIDFIWSRPITRASDTATGRIRENSRTRSITSPRFGPDQLRQVFNDTDIDVLWLIVGAPEETQFLPGAKAKPEMSLIYPVDPKQLPKELARIEWPSEG